MGVVLCIRKGKAKIICPAAAFAVFKEFVRKGKVKFGKISAEICNIKLCAENRIFFKKFRVGNKFRKSADGLDIRVVIEEVISVFRIIKKVFIGASDAFGISFYIGCFRFIFPTIVFIIAGIDAKSENRKMTDLIFLTISFFALAIKSPSEKNKQITATKSRKSKISFALSLNVLNPWKAKLKFTLSLSQIKVGADSYLSAQIILLLSI